jgi:hypothetical protein
MNLRQGYFNFRQDLRYYSAREYSVMVLCALGAGLVLALMLNALSGGSAAGGQDNLRRASLIVPAPAVNFAVVEHARDLRVAEEARRAQILAARHAHEVRVRARAGARAARARLLAATAKPRSQPGQQQTAVRQPTVVAPRPSPTPAPAPQRKTTGTAGKKAGGSLQFDDSG